MRIIQLEYFDREDWVYIWRAIENTWSYFEGTKDPDEIWDNYQTGIQEGAYTLEGELDEDEVDSDLLVEIIRDQTGFSIDRVLLILDDIIDKEAKMKNFNDVIIHENEKLYRGVKDA